MNPTKDSATPIPISLLKDKNLHLSLEVRDNVITTCFLDKDTNQYLNLQTNKRNPDEDTKQFIKRICSDSIWGIPASSISIVFCENKAMLVPAGFFKKEWTEDYLKQQHLLKPGEIASTDYIKNLDSYNLYAINSNSFSVFKSTFSQAQFRHHSSIFIEYLLTLNKDSKTDEVHVCVFPAYIDIVVLQSGKLTLYNRFSYETASDFTYYIIWVYEQLKLNNEKTKCIFYGEIEENSENYKTIQKYISLCSKAEIISLFMQYLCI